MDTLLKLNRISAAYGQSPVLGSIDLDVPPRCALVLIGPNGVGKTSLLKTIIGVQPLTLGSIHFEGTDVTDLPAFERARAGIGYVPQGRHIFPHLTVAENLETGL